MYNKFDELNRRTRDFNNSNVNKSNNRSATESKYYWLTYSNRETYKKNNDRYSKYYF